jgi:LuxR family transcriptional regulator, maltose regulon positive regulatory protein
VVSPDSLPEEWYSTYTALKVYRAASLVATGASDAGARYLDDVEQQLARVTTLRCFIACFHNDLPTAEKFAYQALGDTYRGNGRWKEARDAYLKVLDFDQSALFVRPTHVYGALADLALRQGRLRDAAEYWRKAFQTIQGRQIWGRLPLPLIGWVYVRQGELLYEWNQLGKAGDYLTKGLEHAELGGDLRILVAGYLIAGRAKLTEGDVEAAVEYLERANPLVEKALFPDWTSRYERFQLEIWMAQGRLSTAVEWAERMLHSGEVEERPESEVSQLAIAHELIVNGDSSSIEQALSLLGRLLQATEAEGRAGVAIEAVALQALAQWRNGDGVGAMAALERAPRLAEPEGFVRLFVDLGLPMARLLQEARSRAVILDYVAKLLASFGADAAISMSTERGVPDPLTQREQEILELVAAGLTNQEIAEKLVISPETVKKHTGSIYSKLRVSNRTAAKAKALDLLN